MTHALEQKHMVDMRPFHINFCYWKQEPKRFIGSLSGGVALKKHCKKTPNLLGSLLPKCAHSLRTQDQGTVINVYKITCDSVQCPWSSTPAALTVFQWDLSINISHARGWMTSFISLFHIVQFKRHRTWTSQTSLYMRGAEWDFRCLD